VQLTTNGGISGLSEFGSSNIVRGGPSSVESSNGSRRPISILIVKITWGGQVRANPLHLTPYD
jgi:hypothetical protein